MRSAHRVGGRNRPVRNHRPEAAITRPATSADVPALLRLQNESPEAAHWSEATYKDILAGEPQPRLILVTETAGEVVGFVVARFTAGECDLENIVVSAAERRKGIATELIDVLIAEACKRNGATIFLEVRGSNSAAKAFYQRCGFRISGIRKDYYINPREDAVLFRFTVAQPSA